MVENQDGEKIEFTSEGGSPVYISLSQARVMAVRTAQASPGRRRWILRRRMLFDVLDDYEDEDGYTIVLSFRPGEDFEGTTGQDQLKFSKSGMFEDREVLSHPKYSKRFRIKRKTAALGVIAAGSLIVFAVLVVVLTKTYGHYGDP